MVEPDHDVGLLDGVPASWASTSPTCRTVSHWPGAQARRIRPSSVEQYTAGRSLRELAELTDRSFSAVRNIFDKQGVRRRAVGAAQLLDEPGTTTTR